MSREQLLKKLTTLDFMATDLALYCDTHPADSEAIEAYNHVIIEAGKARREYEENYGPICSCRSKSKPCWDWIDNPWPWQKQFNFNLCEER